MRLKTAKNGQNENRCLRVDVGIGEIWVDLAVLGAFSVG